MKYEEVEGDLISLAKSGAFDVIAHGCNCFCIMGAGIAPQMALAFNADSFPLEDVKLRGDISKLGNIDYKFHSLSPAKGVHVVNAYTQYGLGANHEGGQQIPLSYNALHLCMQKINHIFKGKHIGLPQIGCGLGGAEWSKVKAIILSQLTDCDVTVVFYSPKK